MAGSDSADGRAAISYPRTAPPPAAWLPSAGTCRSADMLPETPYAQWRRKRYSWLYEDEDIWASF